MKIAILISGEYRTFDICRPSMAFLDHPDVDVYVSTWNKTIYDLPILDIHIEEDVTLEQIQKTMGRDVTVVLEKHNLIPELKYNSKLIHRWNQGIELIKSSNIDYDYILILRPDLYFGQKITDISAFVEKYKDSFASAWHNLPNNSLSDIVFMATYDRMISLFNDISVKQWVHDNSHYWHMWWFDIVSKHFTSIVNLDELSFCNFCRVWARDTDTYEQITEIQHDWRDITIQKQLCYIDENKLILIWNKSNVEGAKQKWKSGYYSKYKPRVALVIVGMLRNYESALLSLDIFGKCDRFLITWESSEEDKINNYRQAADLKNAFIISDAKFEMIFKPEYQNGNNTFRMVYLWEQIYKNIPDDYDRYIIVRPDVFYWTTDTKKVHTLVRSEGPLKVSQSRNLFTNGIDDLLMIVSKSHFNKFQSIYSDLKKAVDEMISDGTAVNIYGYYLNPHELLFRLWKQDIPQSEVGTATDICSNKLHSCLEPLIVRETFNGLSTDEYNWELYKAIFYDTAAMWRRRTKLGYHGKFNRLGHNDQSNYI